MLLSITVVLLRPHITGEDLPTDSAIEPIFLTQTDDFSAKTASELCGKEDQWKVNYNISTRGHDARVSLWTGKSVAHKANVTTSKSYNTQSDFRFDTKTFTELKNAQTITLTYDGFNPLPPTLMYLKPCFLDVNKSYFRQVEDGELSWEPGSK